MSAALPAEPSILIVDDEIDSLTLLAATLSDRGYKVRKAIGGAMALMGVRAAPPSLIILDIKMPEMSGYEVCEQLKSDPDTQHIPIIFLSILDEPLDKVKAFSLGAADYIAKPFQIEEAIARVNHQLTIQALHQQLATQNRDLKAANEQLQLEISERKRTEAERDRLLKSERAANRAKDDFLATVSHELRSPLANMHMAIRMLDLGATAEKRERYMKVLRAECEREINLIEDLLDWQRLVAGGIPLTPTTIDLVAWLPPLIAPFAERALTNQQILDLSLPDRLPTITTDIMLFERVATELLNNACKYTPTGGKITVSLEALPHAIAIVICNTAVPFPPDTLGRIFERFYRIEAANPRHQGGTGLGLALVQKFIELLGGTIAVTTPPDAIAFTITLPLQFLPAGENPTAQ